MPQIKRRLNKSHGYGHGGGGIPGESGVGCCAVSYCRVSTGEQAREGVSLAAQRDRIEQHCSAREWALIGHFADEGISGRKASNRPGLESALRLVCEQRAVLCVYSLSRLARSTPDAISIAARLQRAGAQLVMLAEQVDSTTAVGRMFYTVLAALAAFESDQIGERTATALAYKRSRGERWCCHAPYGFVFDGTTTRPSVDEQRVIQRMRRLRLDGVPYRRIAATLTSERLFNRSGSPFPESHVRRILSRHDCPYAVEPQSSADRGTKRQDRSRG